MARNYVDVSLLREHREIFSSKLDVIRDFNAFSEVEIGLIRENNAVHSFEMGFFRDHLVLINRDLGVIRDFVPLSTAQTGLLRDHLIFSTAVLNALRDYTVIPFTPTPILSVTQSQDVKRDRWQGIALPITKLKGGYWRSKNTLELVWSSIMMILGTQVGTRLMRPDFGSQLPSLVFEPNDATLESLARRFITDSLAKWEPRIEIQSVDAFANDDEFSILIQARLIESNTPFEGSFAIFRNEEFRLVKDNVTEVF